MKRVIGILLGLLLITSVTPSLAQDGGVPSTSGGLSINIGQGPSGPTGTSGPADAGQGPSSTQAPQVDISPLMQPQETSIQNGENGHDDDRLKNLPAALEQAPKGGYGRSASVIEKSYRLQYSQFLVEQISKMEHAPATPQMVESRLTQFGYNFFAGSRFSPTKIVVSEDYVLGPGDVLEINIWAAGQGGKRLGAVVEPDGTIVLPGFGVISVSGVLFRDINKLLSAEIEKQIKGAYLVAKVVKPKSIEVYVLGQVKRPGILMVPPFSTVLDALTVAGGPLKTGTLRNIKIKRGGETLKEIDLYSFILQGNTQDDVMLKDKDTIFVPQIGPTTAVVGAVPNSGIFELTGPSASLQEILSYTGQVFSQAQVTINVRRFENSAAKGLQDQYGLWGGKLLNTEVVELIPQNRNYQVRNGDLIEINFAEEIFPPKIKLRGNVWFPQEFIFEEGLKISDIIPGPDVLKPGTLMEYALLHQYDPQSTQYVVSQIPLADILNGHADVLLSPYDEIEILSEDQFGIKKTVFVQGAVWKPGEYRFSPFLDLQSLLAQSGGPKDSANLRLIEITRQNVCDGLVQTDRFRVCLPQDASLRLQPNDTVVVPEVKDFGVVHMARIQGQIANPGEYPVKAGERISSLVHRAGYLLPHCYLYGATFISSKARKLQQDAIDKMIDDLELRVKSGISDAGDGGGETEAVRKAQESFVARLRKLEASGRVTIDLAAILAHPCSESDLFVESGDSLTIPKRPGYVNVLGSVYQPNSYAFVQGQTVGDYLTLAGGPTKTADPKYTYVLKANGTVLAKHERRDYFQRFLNYQLSPGDTVIVPENLEHVPGLRYTKDVSDILYKIAVAAGVTVSILN